ncbi:hypothetical protein FLBR109950_09880 [Flavobacterium branchiophilum]|uniref:Uncharacterized protein n=1 Tax=Flavobacterium branchiophilum (strain FL-15) TaxID=1034807 RepID=G2Z5R1_FLABF|nr:hypothetical protein [Flavobacterium branchiophilum]CCB70862.1 Protein of unknown function [Flavobacterium branchiophilum FL-15]
MKTLAEQIQTIQTLHQAGQTIEAALYLLDEYDLYHYNFKGFELREPAKPDFILMTTEGTFGEPQIIRIPENTFEFPFELMLNLLAHEMVHVVQKSDELWIEDKNEREWQAYYEMIFLQLYPKVPNVSVFHQKFFAEKAFLYYNRMGENTPLQLKYLSQKQQLEAYIQKL